MGRSGKHHRVRWGSRIAPFREKLMAESYFFWNTGSIKRVLQGVPFLGSHAPLAAKAPGRQKMYKITDFRRPLSSSCRNIGSKISKTKRAGSACGGLI